jgi:chemotaxis family two-component system sensor kinase Cph1
MRNLINDLLDFSRIGSEVTFRHINLKSLVEEILEEQQSEIQTTGAVVEMGAFTNDYRTPDRP